MKNRLLYVFAIITVFMCNTVLASGEVKKVYLNEAIDAALKNNIDLQAEKININIAKNNIKSANRLQNPSFDAFYFIGAAGNS